MFLVNQGLLTWGSVTGVTSYKIRQGTSTGVYGNSQDVGNVTQYLLKNISPVLSFNTTYFLVVAGVDGGGDGPNSNEIQVRNGVQIA